MLNLTPPLWRQRIIVVTWAAVIGGVLCFLVFSEKSPLFFFIYMRHLINQQERLLLFRVDHSIVAEELRSFGEEQKWAERGFDNKDPKVPAALRVLKPSAMFVHSDCVSLDFGGPLFEMELRAFKPGLTGQGTKKLGEGLWFYSEDGSYPDKE